jgi:hypothetical protein
VDRHGKNELPWIPYHFPPFFVGEPAAKSLPNANTQDLFTVDARVRKHCRQGKMLTKKSCSEAEFQARFNRTVSLGLVWSALFADLQPFSEKYTGFDGVLQLRSCLPLFDSASLFCSTSGVPALHFYTMVHPSCC